MSFSTWYIRVTTVLGEKNENDFFCFIVAKNLAIGFDFVGGIDLQSWISRCWRLIRSGAVVVGTGLEREFFCFDRYSVDWI